MRFLIDAQLPPRLVEWLEAAGHVAEHVTDIGLGEAPDRVIWQHALRIGAAIATKDRDFADRTVQRKEGPGVLRLTLGNVSRPVLWQRLGPKLPQIVSAFEEGERLVILARD